MLLLGAGEFVFGAGDVNGEGKAELPLLLVLVGLRLKESVLVTGVGNDPLLLLV